MNRGECFRVLGLSEDAPEEDVRKAYKKLALRTHPDKNPNDPEAGKRFLQISEAYKRIVDPDSFKDEDEDEDMNEEEMAAMFNAMLFEMFGGGGMVFSGGESNGMHHMPAEFFEMMMMGEGFDGDDDSDDELGDRGLSVLEAAMMMRGGEGFGDFCGDDEDEESGDEAAVFAKLMGLMGASGSSRVGGRPPHPSQFSGKSKSGKKKKQSGRNKGGNSLPGRSGGGEVGDEEEWETDSEEEVERKRNTGGGKSRGRGSGDHREFEFSGELGLEQMLMAAAMGGAGGRGMDMNSLSQMMAMMGMDGEDDDDDEDDEAFMRAMMGGRPAPTKRNAPLPKSSPVKSKTTSSSTPEIGDRVVVHSKHQGVVKFVGTVAYAAGVYVGVEMDDPSVGKNSGLVKGIRYFQCADGRGLMVKANDIRKITLNSRK